MDASEYKQVKSSPDVFAVAELEATIQSLKAINSPLSSVVETMPRFQILHPLRHFGVAEFVRIQLSSVVVSDLVGDLLASEAAAVADDGTTTPEASQRADLVVRWGAYEEWLETTA
jgi:hypothetical protein